MKRIRNRTFNEIRVGDTAKLTRVLTKKDILLFAIISGDVNPAHVDAEYAKHDIFHKIVAHGMWSGALISNVLGTLLPGPGTIYLSQTLKFHKPLGIGDRITVKVTVVKKYIRKPNILLTCLCTNQKRMKIASGCAKVIAPIEKINIKRIRLPKVVLKGNKNTL